MGSTNSGMRRYQAVKRKLSARGLSTTGKTSTLEARLRKAEGCAKKSSKKAPKKATRRSSGKPAGHKVGCSCPICRRTGSPRANKTTRTTKRTTSSRTTSSSSDLFPWGW